MIAALQTPPTPAPAPSPIRDIAPPIDVFPYPAWMVVVASVVALALLGLVVWLLVRRWRRRPPAPPPTPRAIALRDLERLREKVELLDPYAFSIAVSDVLRGYITGQFGLPAAQQTSPEFLASIAGASQFTDAGRELLARFLERCDLIKFAHISATSAGSSELLTSAIAFVQGARA